MEVKLDLEDEDYEKLSKRADRNGFDSPEEYGSFMIETVLDELETETGDDVRDRLEDLGYM